MPIDPSYKPYINQASFQGFLKGKLFNIPFLGNIVNRMQMKKAEKADKLLDKAIKYLKNDRLPLAEECFIKYAKCGYCDYANGFYILGKKYINQESEVGQEKGIKYLIKAAKSNHLASYLDLAKIYEQKANQDKKHSKETITYYGKEATKYYEKAEKLGSKEASLALGYIYLYGNLAEKNLDKAIDLFGKAGSLRSGLAGEIYSWKNRGLDSQEKYFYLAEIFIDNIKSDTKPALKEKYTNEAINYYEVAGKLGCIEAYLRLSPIYLYEKRDLEKRTKCLEQAAELGSPVAKFHLKTLYTQSADTHFEKGEFQKAIDYYEKAAEKLHPQACKRLSEIYSQGVEGHIAVNQDLAKKHLEKYIACNKTIPFIDEDLATKYS